MGAEVGRFERSFFLFLALFCQAFCLFFGTVNFLEFLKLIPRFLLEKLKVMFPFSTDTLPYA